MYYIDFHSRVPMYEQLYKKIIQLVVKQVLKPGDKLPSVRELAKKLGVNPNTVSKAYNELEHENIIYSLPGRGSFISASDKLAITEKVLMEFDVCVGEAIRVGITKDELIARLQVIKNTEDCNGEALI